MADNIQIPIEILTQEAIDQIRRFAKNSESSLKGIEKTTKKTNLAFNGIKSSLSGISTVAKTVGAVLVTALAGRAIINAIDTFTEKAKEFENSLIGVRSVAANFGITANEITSTVESLASDGLVPVKDVANSLKNLLATGLNLEESTKLFIALKDAAAFGRQGFLDLGQAIEGATQGIKNGQSTLVDNAGITKNLSVLQKEYAASIGTTIGKLTEVQKRQAVYQGILREATIFTGDATRLQETYTGAVAKLDFAINKLQVRFGKFVTTSPAITKIINVAADAFNQFTGIIENNSEAVAQFIKSLSIFGVDAAQFIIDFVTISQKGFETFALIIEKGVISAISSILKLLDKLNDVSNFFTKFIGFTSKGFKGTIAGFEEATKIINKEIDEVAKTDTFLEKVSETLGQVSNNLKKIEPTKNLDSLNKQIKNTSLGADEANANIKTLSEESIEFLERIGSRFSKVTADIQQSLGKVGQSIKSAFDFKFGTGAAEQKRELEQLENDLEKAFKAGKLSEDAFKAKKGDLKKLRKELERNTQLAIGTGLLNSFAKGSQGATELVTGLGGLVADAFVPGLGQAVGPLLDVFAQGPEATKKAFDEFAQALPTVIENVILAIPAAIEAVADNVDIIIYRLVDRIDEIILALVDRMPEVSIALAKAFAIDVPIALAEALPQTLIDLARGFVDAIVKFIVGAFNNLKIFFSGVGKKIFDGFWNGIKGIGNFFYNLGKDIFTGLFDALRGGFGILSNLFKKIFKFDGGGRGPVEKFLGFDFPFIAFAKGGIVPGKSNVSGDSSKNDIIPALLSPGEMIIPRSIMKGGAFSIIEFIKKMGINIPGFFLGGIIGDAFDYLSDGFSSVISGGGEIVGGIVGEIPIVNDIAENFIDLFNQYREIIESLSRIGAKINLRDLARDPLGVVSNAVKSVLDFFRDNFKNLMSFPMANGGLIPNGFPNDTFPARLTSGEFVIDRSMSKDLQDFLSSQKSQNASNDVIEGLLSQLISLMKSDQQISTKIEFRDDTLADIILNLSRNNARLA